MSEKLLAKCIEYGIIGESKEFLEKLENRYNSVYEEGALEEKNICDYIDSVRKGTAIDNFRDEQSFFISVGLVMSALYEYQKIKAKYEGGQHNNG